MQISVLENQKTSGGLGNLHVNGWQKKGEKIGMGTLYLISCHLQESGLD